jgi:predicted dehydrogenase
MGYQVCENVEVVAFSQRTRDKAKTIAKEFNIPKIYTDYHELLNLSDIDAVSITTPPNLHHRMVLEAIAQGKHVFCEKPLAMNAKEAEEMYHKAENAELIHMIGFESRFIPAAAYMKQLIDQGYVGPVFQVHDRSFSNFRLDPKTPLSWIYQKEKAGVGMLGSTGVHRVDLVRWMCGEFRNVFGNTKIFIKKRPLLDGSGTGHVTTEDAAAILAELEGGIQVTLNISGVTTPDQTLEVYGNKGLLIYKRGKKGLKRITGTLWGTQSSDRLPKELPTPVHLTANLKTDDEQKAFGQFLFAHINRRFVQAIRENKQSTPNFLDGLKAQKVIDAILKSNDEELWINLD